MQRYSLNNIDGSTRMNTMPDEPLDLDGLEWELTNIRERALSSDPPRPLTAHLNYTARLGLNLITELRQARAQVAELEAELRQLRFTVREAYVCLRDGTQETALEYLRQQVVMCEQEATDHDG